MSDYLSAAEELAVIRQINRFFAAVDRRDYDALLELLSPRPQFDYSQLGKQFSQDPQVLAATIRRRHAPYARVQHVTTNHIVSGSMDQAAVVANFVAHHTLPQSPDRVVWTLGGRYEFRLSKIGRAWCIEYCAIQPIWSQGTPVPVHDTVELQEPP